MKVFPYKRNPPLKKKSCTVHFPIPVLHPVTMAVFPSNLVKEVHFALNIFILMLGEIEQHKVQLNVELNL